MSFKDAAVESAQLYYEYLEKNRQGEASYNVIGISLAQNSFNHNEYWLQLDGKPKNIDSLKIRIRNSDYNSEQIKPVVYNGHNQKLKISVNDSTKGVFERCRPEDVKVFSDLKFLVRHVKEWYLSNGRCIALPAGKRTVELSDCHMLSEEPSEDQALAIQGSLSEPFTYVWGAPGTGKTRFVLARSVLANIQAGKRILVTAPTNNAVEQTLYGILPVLEEAGLDYNKLVIRLGTANADFLSKYPGVCEDSGYSKAIAEILDSLSELRLSKEETTKKEQLYIEYQTFQQKHSSFMDTVESLKKLMSRISEAGIRFMRARSSLDEIRKNIAQKETERAESDNSQAFYNRQAQDLLQKLHNPIHAVLSWFNKKDEQKKIDDALENARYYENKLAGIKAELSRLDTEAKLRQASFTEERIRLEKLIFEAIQLTEPYEELYAAAKTIRTDSTSDSLHELKNTCERTQASFEAEKKNYEPIWGRDRSYFEEEKKQIEQKIQQFEQRKIELEQADPNKRIEKCQVIACTIDLCLYRFPVKKENHFDHVFLDEASYSSLIKAVALTAYSDQITFLGDHMQLPPVCEADDETINARYLLAFWAQSALFTETVFYESPKTICSDYLNRKPIPFAYMKKYNLVHSYRFGETLARVLADDVYDSSFRGHDGQDTRIYYINTPKRREPERRISHSECESIAALLRHYKGLRNTSGIIAPYRKQVSLLREMTSQIPFPQESVVTVHQSQGREWDNVFFSITDTTDMYFTNSLSSISDGKKVINTAVSRARKNLVIVCDYNYWITQKSQLIGKLLSIAQPLDT